MLTARFTRIRSHFARPLCLAVLTASAAMAGCSTPFAHQERLTLTAPSVRSLVLRNCVGDVIIQADGSATQVRADVVKSGRGLSAQQADEALGEIELSMAVSPDRPDTIVAEGKHPGGDAFRSHSVDWRITAPPGVVIDVTNDVGDIHIKGFAAGATIRGSVGDIHVRGVSGGLTVQNEVGDVHAQASGTISIDSGVGDVALTVGEGDDEPITARTEVGDLTVALPAQRKGRLVADSDVGSLHIHLDDTLLHNTRQRAHHFDAQLAGVSEPTIDLATEVGDLKVRSYRTP